MGNLPGRAAFYLAFGSAVSVLFSIAVSQILLGLALAALLLSGDKLEFPPIRLPLAVFFGITLIALLASGDPHAGLPQIRKFFVFGIMVVICSTFRTLRQIEMLVLAWAGCGGISAMRGLAQFVQRRQEALAQNANNYGFIVDGRITGFAGHWMTFGGEEMLVLLMAASLLLFSGKRKYKPILWPVLALLLASVTLGMTRCIFLLGVPAGLAYLVWRRRPVLILAAAAVAVAGLALSPAVIRERIVSVFRPHGELDSNAHRAVCRAVGWEMVKAHPWIGLGPEQVGRRFDRYIPASVKRPLPNGWYGHLHNIYLQYAAERGVPGLVAFLWLIATIARDFLGRLRQGAAGSQERAILHGAMAVTVAILAEGLFEYNLGDSEVLTMFLSVIACGYTAIRLGTRVMEPAPELRPRVPPRREYGRTTRLETGTTPVPPG